MPFGVKDTQPLNSLFGADVLKDVLTQDELRNEMGFDSITSAKSNATTDAISTISPLVASKVLDNMSLEEIRELIGLKTTEEQKIKINETKSLKMSSKNILDDLIDLYGQDENLEEWELIDEEDATDEHEDFDFQYNIEKLELASTGRAIPNAKSEQDGVSTQTHKTKYRVRYVYTTEKTFNNPNEGLPSRDVEQIRTLYGNLKAAATVDISGLDVFIYKQATKLQETIE